MRSSVTQLSQLKSKSEGPVLTFLAMIYDRLMTTRFFVAFAAGSIFLAFFCLGRYPASGGDEVIIASSALNLLKHGTLARPIHHGSGFDVFDCMPPVAPILMAASYATFGFGVIQTKFPGIALGIGTAILLFTMAVGIGGKIPAAIATIIFITDPVTFGEWQFGRYDAIFVFAVAASLFLAYRTFSGTKNRIPIIWFVIGLTTGLAGATYYPFALAAGLISFLSLLALIWCNTQFNLRERISTSLCFAGGLGVVIVTIGAWMYPHLAQCQAQVLGISPAYLDVGTGLSHQVSTALGEWQRYWMYSIGQGGLLNLLLGILIVVIIPWTAPKRWEFAVLWAGLIAFTVFLSIYGSKDSRYMGVPVLLVYLALAVVYREIEANRLPKWSQTIVKQLSLLTIAASVIRLTLIAFTLTEQWEGRDFEAFNAQVRGSIPSNANVIGPQKIFYALADANTNLWLYPQGDTQFAQVTGTVAMNDPLALADVSYVVIDELQVHDYLQGLRDYLQSNFRLLVSITPRFNSLPWAKTPLLDVKIYERNP